MEEKQKRETISLLPGGLDLMGGNRIKKLRKKKKRGGRKERREERRGEKYLTMISASETLMFKTSYGDQRPPSRGQVQPATCYRMACELGIVSMFSNG